MAAESPSLEAAIHDAISAILRENNGAPLVLDDVVLRLKAKHPKMDLGSSVNLAALIRLAARDVRASLDSKPLTEA